MRQKWSLEALLFSFIFGVHVFTFGGGGMNQHSRLALLHALVFDQQYTIDRYEHRTIDKAFVNGHFYSEKAPGVVALALPAFALGAAVTQLMGWPHASEPGWTFLAWWTTSLTAGLITGIGAIALFRVLRLWVSERTAFCVSLACFLVTPLFTYAVSLFSHAITGSFITLALMAIFVVSPKWRWRSWAIGVCLGTAVTCEYPAFLVAVSLLIWLRFRGSVRWPFLLVGFVLPLFLIALNNWLVTGLPWLMPYDHVWQAQAPQTLMGTLRLALPNPILVVKLLFSGSRGLLYWSPLLWLALPGFLLLWQRHRSFAICSAAIVCIQVVFVSGLGPDWHGGWALGPRHLTFIVPFLALPVALAFERWPRTGFCLMIGSFLLTTVASLSDHLTPQMLHHPLFQFYWPRYQQWHFGTNLLTLFGFKSVWGVVLIAGVTAAMCEHVWRVAGARVPTKKTY